MRLNQPKMITFLAALVVVIVALLLHTVIKIDTVSINAVWVAALGYAILALGNMVKGL